jgi:hypothetical protein
MSTDNDALLERIATATPGPRPAGYVIQSTGTIDPPVAWFFSDGTAYFARDMQWERPRAERESHATGHAGTDEIRRSD